MMMYTAGLDTMNISKNELSLWEMNELMEGIYSQFLLLRRDLGILSCIKLLGVVCVLIVIMFILTRQKKIKHSSHEHPLVLLKKRFKNDSVLCKGCEKAFSGKSMVYGCKRCKYYLHKFCAELQQEIVSFFHPCTLNLHRSHHIQCNGCDKSKLAFGYCCRYCNFNLDVDCALQSTVTPESDELIQHFSHLHLLKLIERKEDDNVWCNVCEQPSEGLMYGCDRCNYFLHKSCMDNLRQKIQHVFHKCTLILLRVSSFQCECCGETRSGLAFCCGRCKYYLDVQCALLPTKVSDTEKQIKHFLHGHPLTMREKGYVDVAYCKVCGELCGELCSGVTYSCRRCDFSLHDSCARLPQTVQHSFHTCRLVLYNTSTYTCNGCDKVQSGLVFCCRKCSFYLDVECAQLPTVTSDAPNKIQHFSHEHPLVVLDKPKSHKAFCESCEKSCSGQAYGCIKCNYNLHISCALLPREVQHFFHTCPLALTKNPSYECDACDENSSGLAFRCEKCDFDLDIECALLPTIDSKGHEKIQHFSHGHSLVVSKKSVIDDVSCDACGESCSGLTYDCGKCNYLLHGSCAILPREIQHSFHSGHPLTLMYKTFDCDVCYMHFRGFSYNCAECKFDMHIECASLKACIKYKPHEHLLTFVKQMYRKPICKACDSSLSTNSFLRCVECDYNVHLLCSPLPQIIKHPCHIDNLFLKDCLIEHLNDSCEYYCDACEAERDPEDCVYYCEECDFIAHVTCVLSEVLPILMGEREDLKFGIADRNIALDTMNKKSVILKEILESLSEDEKTKFDDFESNLEKDMEGLKDKIHRSQRVNIDGIMKYHSYSDVDFITFFFTMELGLPDIPLDFLDLKFVDYEAVIVNVGNLKVTRDLENIVHELLSKYGDFTADVELNPDMKTYCLVIFAAVIRNICNCKVIDVTVELLLEWWICCKLAQYLKFNVPFAFQCLNKVAYARFSLVYSELYAGTTLCRIQEEITKVSGDTEDLTKKLETLKITRKQHISSTRSARSTLSEELLLEALELRSGTARMALL